MNIQKTALIPLEKYERIKACRTKTEVEPHHITTDDEESERLMLDKDMILQTMPKMYRSKGQALLNFIEKGKVLSWNDKGELVHKGKILPNSDIADLVKDAMREYKNFDPTGKEEFYNGLAETNIPLLLIDNRSKRELVIERKSKTLPRRKISDTSPKSPQWIHI